MVLYSIISPTAYPQAAKTCAQPAPATDEKFVAGQVWSFKSRSFEPDSTITILKVESLPKIGEVIHVRIAGIRLRNCSGGLEPDQVQHAPFTRQAIAASVVRLIRTGATPDFAEGYSNWLSHCGGVYTITVPQMVLVDESTFNSQSGCTP